MKFTKYLRSNTFTKMPLILNDRTRGFAFVTALYHARDKLLKFVIEAARCVVKIAKTIVKSNHSIRPQVVVNRFPEDQDVFSRPKLVPGELFYTNAAKSTRLNSGEQTV